MPRDEPLAENPPNGALIDYYLKSKVAGVVTLEILDPAGEIIRRYASDDKVTPVNPDTLSIPAFWVRPTEVLSTGAGMHRWLWDLRPTPTPRPAGAGGGGGGGGFGRGGGSTVVAGKNTVKKTPRGERFNPTIVRTKG